MNKFCSQCALPLDPNVAFCPRCGTPRSAGNPPPQAKSKSKSGGLIITVALIFFALAGLAIYGVVSFVKRTEKAVVAKAESYGVDLGTSHPAKTAKANAKTPTCDLLSKDSVAQLIGHPIDHVEPAKGEPATCLYYGPHGLSAQLAKEVADSTFKNAEKPGSTVGGIDIARAVSGVLAPYADANGDSPLLVLVIGRGDGKAQMTALTATGALFNRIPGGAVVDVPNLGDRAVRAANLGLNVRQGEDIVRIIVGSMPAGDEKSIAIAHAVLPKL